MVSYGTRDEAGFMTGANLAIDGGLERSCGNHIGQEAFHDAT